MKNILLVFHILLIFSIVGCADKAVYVGEKKDGKNHGQGTLTFSSGKKYVGEFKDGKIHGQGTWTFPDGKKYVGEFKDGRYHGQGTETFPDGSKFVGGWKDGKRHGQATKEYPDGRKYVGEYKRNRKEGFGIMTYKDGSKFEGEWKGGRPFNGKGVVQGNEGKDIREGEWVNGKMEGYGKRSNSNNKRWYKSYEGEFKNGKFHGQGKMLAKKIMTDDMARSPRLAKLKGLTFIGEFKNGRPHNVKSFNDSGEPQSIVFNDGVLAGFEIARFIVER